MEPETFGKLQEVEVMTFGKYKGQPVEVLLADENYREWLLAQPGFAERNVSLYQTIINHGTVPADSPEHNSLQALFLDDEFCLALAKHLTPTLGTIEHQQLPWGWEDIEPLVKERPDSFQWEEPEHLLSVCDRNFEVHGWDVVFTVIQRPPALVALEDFACKCGHSERHRYSCPAQQRWERHRYSCPAQQRWASGGFVAGYAVECKPSIGDDYPNVLRQVKRYMAYRGASPWGGVEVDKSWVAVVVREAAFTTVTWEQVVAIFAASRIHLVQCKI